MRCGVGGLKTPLRCFERSRRAGPLHCAHVTRARPVGRPLLLYFAPCNGPTRRSETARRRLGENVPRRDTANVWPKALSPMPIPVDLVYLGFYTVPALGGQDGNQFIRQTTSLNAAWARYGCRPRQPHLFGCAAGHLPPIPKTVAAIRFVQRYRPRTPSSAGFAVSRVHELQKCAR